MINSFKSFLIEEERTVYFTFGRMNPPTIGHEKLMAKLSEKSGKNPYRVYLSHSQDTKKNPLTFNEKVKYARKMFPKHARQIMSDMRVKNVFDAATKLYNEGYKRVSMVVGSDRINEFDVLLNKYNGKKGRHGFYKFENINVLSAGERDPDAEGSKGMSASKMRQAVMEKDFTSFSQGLPRSVSNSEAKKLYNSVRSGMGLKEQKEFKNHVSLAKVSDRREDYVEGKILNAGDDVIIKENNKKGVITFRGPNYVMVESAGRQNRYWLDAVELASQPVKLQSFSEKMAQDRASKKIDRLEIRHTREKARLMRNAKKKDLSAKIRQMRTDM